MSETEICGWTGQSALDYILEYELLSGHEDDQIKILKTFFGGARYLKIMNPQQLKDAHHRIIQLERFVASRPAH